MSRSEAQALGLVDAAVASGVMSNREADFRRDAVRDPCGCGEGLVVAVVAAVGTSLSGRGLTSFPFARGFAGFAAGAVTGKIYGVAKGLPLVRHQREELIRRVADLQAIPEGGR